MELLPLITVGRLPLSAVEPRTVETDQAGASIEAMAGIVQRESEAALMALSSSVVDEERQGEAAAIGAGRSPVDSEVVIPVCLALLGLVVIARRSRQRRMRGPAAEADSYWPQEL